MHYAALDAKLPFGLGGIVMIKCIYPAFAVLLVASSGGGAQVVPDEPIKHLDGYWYGEERKVEIEVADGVATVKVNESEDKYVQSLNIPAGTVIARLTGFTQDGKRLVRLHGQCWGSGSAPQLIDCGNFNSVLDLSMEAGKQRDRLKIDTLQFRRKVDMPEYAWKYRK